jgi:conjugal transfer pilus assembly protein TrbC
MRRITIVIAAIAGLAGIQAIAQTVDGLDLEAIKRRSAAMQGDADIFAEHVRNRGDAFREEAVAIQAKSSTNLTALAKADLPVNGDGAFDFDEIIKGASQNVAGTKGDAPQFIAFASLSMPPAVLRQLIADTAKAGGVVVFRGFPNNSRQSRPMSPSRPTSISALG